MKKNIRKVKIFQKPLICLIGILLVLLGIVIDRFMNTNADEINYEYQSSNIGYDSTNSSLNATNVKDAIDELYEKVGQCPKGQFCYSSEEIRGISGGNILRAYVYDETEDSSTFCINGEEDTCIKSTCYNNLASGSCPVGTIIDYFVNNSTVIRFHVLHDNGNTITMQTQRTTVYNTAWNSDQIVQEGPKTIMNALKSVTDNWDNVNPINITAGMTEYDDGVSTKNACTWDSFDCSTDSSYEYDTISGIYKARMITLQEAINNGGCIKGSEKTCKIFMYNYLYNSEGNCKISGKCTNDNYINSTNHAYWTMNSYLAADNTTRTIAWRIDFRGFSYTSEFDSDTRVVGARAVVVVNK